MDKLAKTWGKVKIIANQTILKGLEGRAFLIAPLKLNLSAATIRQPMGKTRLMRTKNFIPFTYKVSMK